MEGELKVRHMRYQIAQYEFLIRSVPKTTCFPSKRSFRPNYLPLGVALNNACTTVTDIRSVSVLSNEGQYSMIIRERAFNYGKVQKSVFRNCQTMRADK